METRMENKFNENKQITRNEFLKINENNNEQTK